MSSDRPSNCTLAATLSTRHSVSIIQDDGVVDYFPKFMSSRRADELLTRSLEEILWSQDQIRLFGKSITVPRLTAWFSLTNANYKYSGLVHRPQAMLGFLCELLQDVGSETGVNFNSILVNLYQDGSHSMGWHADNEPELGREVTIASLSIGAEREFRLRHRFKKECRRSVSVAHGSLIMMYPPTQEFWLHELPKRKGITTPRVNFSFRLIQPR